MLQNGIVIYGGQETELRTYGKFLSWRDLVDLAVLQSK